MIVQIAAKQLNKRGNRVVSCPYHMESPPDTLRSLIRQFVSDGVDGYNRRLQAEDSSAP